MVLLAAILEISVQYRKNGRASQIRARFFNTRLIDVSVLCGLFWNIAKKVVVINRLSINSSGEHKGRHTIDRIVSSDNLAVYILMLRSLEEY